jgi:hypothetical protein
MLLTIVLWIIVIPAVLSVPYLIMGMLGAPTDRYPPWFRSIADRICRYCPMVTMTRTDRYIGQIRNRAKQKYAQAFLGYLRGTKIEPSCHAIGFRASRDLRVAILKHWANENDK